MSLPIMELSLYHNVFSMPPPPDLLCINDIVVFFCSTLFLSNGLVRGAGLVWHRGRLDLNLLRVHQLLCSTIQMNHWEDLPFNINAYSMFRMNIKCGTGGKVASGGWTEALVGTEVRIKGKQTFQLRIKGRIIASWPLCNHHAVSQCHFNNELRAQLVAERRTPQSLV